MKTLTIRLKPGADLRSSIEAAARENGISAGFVITCVGGLKQAIIRMAEATPDTQDTQRIDREFEIVSLVGTISKDDSHLHISFSDADGIVRGGHLKTGTIIHPTAEIVIGYEESLVYSRVFDEETGFEELVVS